jgi:hypothetical protein
MAEIKSTLDLVMEKTKHLKLSPEEKLEMQLQDLLKKVPGYVELVLDGALTPELLLDQINTAPPEIAEQFRGEIARQLAMTLDLSEKTDPLIPALEILAETAWSDLLAEVKRCRPKYRKARDDSQVLAKTRILGNLAAAGIRGSAVAAKLEHDESWTEQDRKLRQPCEERLAALIKTLK